MLSVPLLKFPREWADHIVIDHVLIDLVAEVSELLPQWSLVKDVVRIVASDAFSLRIGVADWEAWRVFILVDVSVIVVVGSSLFLLGHGDFGLNQANVFFVSILQAALFKVST